MNLYLTYIHIISFKYLEKNTCKLLVLVSSFRCGIVLFCFFAFLSFCCFGRLFTKYIIMELHDKIIMYLYSIVQCFENIAMFDIKMSLCE